MVRRHGRLSFEDILLVMAGRTSSRQGGDREAVRVRNENISYRLDARYNHWLIDEFQDTSLLQWALIEPLVTPSSEPSSPTLTTPLSYSVSWLSAVRRSSAGSSSGPS